jgi:hypothetical protein
MEQQFKAYFQYVDDILIVYNTGATDINTTIITVQSAASTVKICYTTRW